MTKKIVKKENGVYHYDPGNKIWSVEEVEEANKRYYEEEETALQKFVIPAGFIPFPAFHDLDGELIEFTFYLHPDFEPSNSVGFKERHGNNYNIYIPSYKRAGKVKTVNVVNNWGEGSENWYLAIDPSQFEEYSKHYPLKNLIIRDPSFKNPKYFQVGGVTQVPDYLQGTAGIYNSLLALSRTLGEEKYWTMDDDFITLAMKSHKGAAKAKNNSPYVKENHYRCSRLQPKYGFDFKEFLLGLEEIGQKTRNHGFIGLEKFGLVYQLPIMWKKGTRVYSFYLSDNKTQLRHDTRSNNDVATSLEQSKHGLPPMLFEGICYSSDPTQGGGGMTEVYHQFGTLEKSLNLVRDQPQYSKVTHVYNRLHHLVNYSDYAHQRLVGSVIRDDLPPAEEYEVQREETLKVFNSLDDEDDGAGRIVTTFQV